MARDQLRAIDRATPETSAEALGVFGELKEVLQNFSLPNQICVDGADPDETDCELINRRRDIERLGYAVKPMYVMATLGTAYITDLRVAMKTPASDISPDQKFQCRCGVPEIQIVHSRVFRF